MSALRMMLRPIRYGWSVQLSDGRELARFLGPAAKWRAMRYLQRAAEALKNTGPRPGPAGAL
ncbi:MAG TPA: hypothetical protein VLW51_02845 [Solirubrobacteraceae bacterium]|jgi:hypothetical protein|nr:hypothetical protein [Solirubrobacteraceae bacterium]